MRKLTIFLMVLSLIFLSVAPSVFGDYANVGPKTNFQGDVGTTGVFKVNDTQIAVGDITGAAASGANSDITQLTGLTTMLAPQYGGTGAQNNSASIITITGSFPLTFTISESTGLTLPASGTLVTTGVTTLSSLTTVGTITSGGLGTSATLGAVTVDVASAAENDILYLGASQVLSRLAAEAGGTNKFLRTVSGGAPSYELLVAGDIPDISGTYQPEDTGLTNLAALAYVEASMIKMTNTDTYATRTMSEVRTDLGLVIGTNVLAQQDIGITDDDLVEIDHADVGVVATDYARFTANGLQGRDATEVKTDLGLVIGTNVAAAGANTDITSLTNESLSVGRNATNYLAWDVDNTLKIEINDVLHSIVSISTGAGDHDKLVTQGYVDDAAGAAKNYCEHFMDVLAPVTQFCHDPMTGSGDLQEITTGLTSPDVPRNLVVSFSDTVGSGNVTITGTLADGTTTQTEDFVYAQDSSTIGAKAFATVTKISIPATTMNGATINVGLDNLLGLTNSVDAESDVYKGTIDGGDLTVGTVNTTNNTVDCGTITANSDYTFRYHN